MLSTELYSTLFNTVISTERIWTIWLDLISFEIAATDYCLQTFESKRWRNRKSNKGTNNLSRKSFESISLRIFMKFHEIGWLAAGTFFNSLQLHS